MPGDQVQLTDPKGRTAPSSLAPGKAFHTHRGSVAHDDLIGAPEGSVVDLAGGTRVRRAAPAARRLHAVDAARRRGRLPQGRRADRGHGRHLPRRPGARGGRRLRRADLLAAARDRRGRLLVSYERRPTSPRSPSERGALLRRPASGLAAGDGDCPADRSRRARRGRRTGRRFDRVVLDMLAPWEYVDAAAGRSVPGGLICSYVATTTQLSRSWRHCARTAASPSRRLGDHVRGWHVEGLAVRPEHRMVGHTGFLVTARRLAGGRRRAAAAAPAAVQGRRRRPMAAVRIRKCRPSRPG